MTNTYGLGADLFVPAGSATDWQENSLCSQADPEAFFPEQGASSRDAGSPTAAPPDPGPAAAASRQYDTVMPSSPDRADSMPRNPGCSRASSSIRAAVAAYASSSPGPPAARTLVKTTAV